MPTDHICIYLGGPITFGYICYRMGAEGTFAGPGFYEIHDHKIAKKP